MAEVNKVDLGFPMGTCQMAVNIFYSADLKILFIDPNSNYKY